ncbi:MAG: glycosyltransferase [Conexivisphaera sp.]
MRTVAIISSTVYPASFENYGSEWTNAVLARELARLGYRVYLHAPARSMRPEGVVLRPIPCTCGRIDEEMEHIVAQVYMDELEGADFIIDASSAAAVAEEMFFYRKFNGVYVRNGIDASYPRLPVSQHVHGVLTSRTAVDEAVRRTSWLRRELLHVMPLPVPSDVFTPGEEERDIDFLYVGAARADKATSLLSMVPQLRGKRVAIAVGVTADDHRAFAPRLRELAESTQGVEVIYVENSPYARKLELYRRAKFMVTVPVREYVEAFGLTTVEAMMAGATPVRESWGGSAEIVEDGVSGYLVGSPEEAVRTVLERPPLDPAALRRYAMERFDAPVVAARWAELIGR